MRILKPSAKKATQGVSVVGETAYLKTSTGIWSSGYAHKDGYCRIDVNIDNDKKKMMMQRLVAFVFDIQRPHHLKNVPFEKLTVNHKDLKKQNNSPGNWVR